MSSDPDHGDAGVGVFQVGEGGGALSLRHGAPVRLAARAGAEEDVEIEDGGGLADFAAVGGALVLEELDGVGGAGPEVGRLGELLAGDAEERVALAVVLREAGGPSVDERAGARAEHEGNRAGRDAAEAPSATVNLRGSGATKPSGAEMETGLGSSTARQRTPTREAPTPRSEITPRRPRTSRTRAAGAEAAANEAIVSRAKVTSTPPARSA